MTKETIIELKTMYSEMEEYYRKINFSILSTHFHNAFTLVEEIERQQEIIDKLNAEVQTFAKQLSAYEEKAAPAIE